MLAHEQLHFDIAELHSRKMNKRFAALQDKKIAKHEAYWQVYEEVWQECLAVQRKYDQETEHGLKKEVNREWFQKIEKQLKEL